MISDTVIFIPARGGSNTIPMKNLYPLGGKPLIAWGLEASLRTHFPIVVSTDSPRIVDFISNTYSTHGRVEVTKRPISLRDGPVVDTVIDFATKTTYKNIILVQPTSPFVRAIDIYSVVDELETPYVSAQTITRIPHNHHWVNQRVFAENEMTFYYEKAYNKGRKEKQDRETTYAFGNVVATRVTELIQQRAIFAYPSKGVSIEYPYALDCDDLEAFALGEMLLRGGLGV